MADLNVMAYLNVRPETIQLLEENIGRTLLDINHSKFLYDPPSTAMELKTKITKWDLIKLQSFCTAKEIQNKVKRQPMEFSRQNTGVGRLSLLQGNLSNPGIKPRSPTLQTDSLPAEPQGKSKNTGVGSLSFLQSIFLIQELNQGLLHCRPILYQVSYQEAIRMGENNSK